MSIRRAEEKDIPAIKNLLEQVLLVHHKGRPDLFKEKGWKYTDSELKEILKKEEDPVFVYEDEKGNILGHCFCKTIENEERPATFGYRTLYIDDLCVNESSRGQNIGKKLYLYAKEFARQNGYYNLTLHAWECNSKAVEFYRHLGLKIQQYTMEEIL